MKIGDIVRVKVGTAAAEEWSYVRAAEGRVGRIDSREEGSRIKSRGEIFWRVAGIWPPSHSDYHGTPAFMDVELEPATREDLQAQRMLDELSR
jgi:hypothetical protein